MAPEIRVRSAIDTKELAALICRSWESPRGDDWSSVLSASLTWVTAHDDRRLVGFVNVAWDGGHHAFLLDLTVDPLVRRQGIGTALSRAAVDAARKAGVEWLHVDYEAHLGSFYERCGFHPTSAGLIRL